jgi:hypothetical protein
MVLLGVLSLFAYLTYSEFGVLLALYVIYFCAFSLLYLQLGPNLYSSFKPCMKYELHQCIGAGMIVLITDDDVHCHATWM